MTGYQKSIFIAATSLQVRQVAVGLTLSLGSVLLLAGVDPRQHPELAVSGLIVGALGAWMSASALSRREGGGGLVLALALSLRLLALCMPVGFSDDLYRYIWEGWVGLHGVNPLRVPPASPSLDTLTIPLRAWVNHPELPSVYPPLAQLGFQALAWLEPSVRCFRAGALLIELTLLACLWLTVTREKLPRAGLYFYALHPLPVIELISSAHVDGAALMLTVAALSVGHSTRARARGCGLLLLAGGAVKVLPWVLLPALLVKNHREHGRRFALTELGLWVGVMSLLCLPFVAPLAELSRGLSTYAAHWEFNPSVFRLLRWGLEPDAARRAVQLLFVGLVLWGSRPEIPLRRLAQGAFLAFFLLSPTAHPWYLVWSLGLVPLLPTLTVKVLSVSVGASYLVFSGPNGWGEPPGLWWGVYGPALLALLWEGWQVRRSGRTSPSEGGVDACG